MPAKKAEKSLAIVSLSGGLFGKPSRIGGFSDVLQLVLPENHVEDDVTAQLAAVRLARDAGAGWMILLGPGETLAEDALDLIAPALDLFDAIFGAVHVRGSGDPVARLSRLAFDTAERLPHALLNWWLPQAHFIRTDTAFAILEKMTPDDGWRLDYLFALWSSVRCQKSAQPLLVVDREPVPLDASGKQKVLRRLAEEPVFLPVTHGDTVYHLPYTGQNAGIEREQTRGQFFEAMELEELRAIIGPGARIVDVGANTGNHAVFFAGPMRARSVVVLEPLPGAALALKRSVERNGLTNVDLSLLGVGVGDAPGRARIVSSLRGGLGATSLQADPDGDVAIATLDSLVKTPVDFLKIDVEGMEMSVLAGASRLIAEHRPRIFIEIANRNTAEFCAWLDRSRYRVVRIFSDKGHANYLIEADR